MIPLNEEQEELLNEFCKWTSENKGVRLEVATRYKKEFLKEKGLLKESFEVRELYAHRVHSGLVLCTENDVYINGYGVNSNGRWSDYVSFSKEWLVKANEEDKARFQEALIKEAKKRGFKEGVRVDDSLLEESDGEISYDGSICGEFQYIESMDVLECSEGNGHIFQKGIWATIIEENPTKEETKAILNIASVNDYKMLEKMNEMIDCINSLKK
ncbi:MAG: hypothetical protein HRT87_01270 [Legionellales bacterium]|nr:hypothetical protein [Legionellales bacterium]